MKIHLMTWLIITSFLCYIEKQDPAVLLSMDIDVFLPIMGTEKSEIKALTSSKFGMSLLHW